MARTLYSKTFLVGAGVPGFIVSAPVPAGKVWDVRNAVAVCRTAYAYDPAGLLGFDIASSSGQTILAAQPALQGWTYSIETRLILPAGATITATTLDYFWSIYVSGFELTSI